MIIGIINGIIFAFFVSIIILIKNYERRALSFADWFVISLGFFYGLGQSFVLWNIYNDQNLSIIATLLRWDSLTAYLHLLSSFLAVISVYAGYYFLFRIKQFKKMINLSCLAHLTRLKVRTTGWIFLVISIVSYLMYAHAYGGIEGLLAQAANIRTNTITIENQFSFLQRFGGFAFFASFIFGGILLERGQLSDRLGFIISFSWSLLVLKSWLGRVGIVVFLITFFIGTAIFKDYKRRNKISFVKIIVFILVGGFLVSCVGLIIGRNTQSPQREFLAKELAFPFVSWSIQNENNDGIRWFKDVFVAPIYFLPEKSWRKFVAETASDYNTRIISSADVWGGIPTDYLTFAMLEGHIVGVVILSLLWGFLLHILESLIKSVNIKGVGSMLYANTLLQIMLTVLYADMFHVIRSSFYLIIGIIALILVGKIPKIRFLYVKNG